MGGYGRGAIPSHRLPFYIQKNTSFNITPPHYVKISKNSTLILNICKNI